jgi:hypothetical protein
MALLLVDASLYLLQEIVLPRWVGRGHAEYIEDVIEDIKKTET